MKGAVFSHPSLVARSDVVLNVVSTLAKLVFVLSKIEATEKVSSNGRFHHRSIVSLAPSAIESLDPYPHFRYVVAVAMESPVQC